MRNKLFLKLQKNNELKKVLGYELFHKIFPIILTDNGKKFKRPDLIEDNGNDVVKTKVFFCYPNRSDQKGTIEVTHEYIRKYIDKGMDINNYSEEDIALMINRINNVKRKSLNNQTPYELVTKKIGEETIKKLGIYYIQLQDIMLKPSLFKNNNK